MRVLVCSLFAIALLAPAALAAEGAADAPKPGSIPSAVFASAPGGWYAELSAGFGAVDFEDPDANIAYMERIATENLYAPGPLRYFENSQAYALEVGRRHGHWSWGVATEHQRQRVQTYTAGTNTGALDVISLMTTIDVRLTTTFRPVRLYGFEIGASAGMAFAHYSEQFALYVFPDDQYNANFSGAYHATSFSGGPHLGWRRPLYGNTWLVARGTWLWRNFDELEGQLKQRSAGEMITTDAFLRRLDNGAVASIDASTGQFTFGMSYTFGGRR